MLVVGLSLSAQAASSSWNVDANGNWNTNINWTADVPGLSFTTNTDVATFALTLTSARTVTVDANRNIGGITFGNISTNGYTLSGGTLGLNSGGVIQTIAGTGVHQDKVNTSLTIQGDGGTATFRNNSASAGLIIGGAVSGASSSGNTTILTLDGSSTAGSAAVANQVSGTISDGTAGGKLTVVKNDTGTWTLTGNNTFTGGMSVNSGTIRYFGTGTVFGRGLLTLSNNVTLNHGNNSLTVLSNQVLVKGNFSLTGVANSNAWSGAWDLNSGVRTITVSASNAISGVIANGGLTKAGADVLVLSGLNTYADGTTVSAGTLTGVAAGAFGTGSVTVSNGATLILQNVSTINDSAALVLNSTSTLRLDFTGADTVGSISLDGGVTTLAAGTYNVADLTAAGGLGTYTGTGSLTVVGSKGSPQLFMISSL